jgi:hypothetical protein
MRQIEEIDADINALEEQLAFLAQEKKVAEEHEQRMIFLNSISDIGVQISGKKFPDRKATYASGQVNPVTGGYEYPSKAFHYRVQSPVKPGRGKWADAIYELELYTFDEKNWYLLYSLWGHSFSYSYSNTRPRSFVGTKAEALLWAKGEMEKKLLDVKKENS